MTEATPQAASVDPREVDKFSAMAEAWWDEEGAFKPLHQLNPLRLGFIRDQAAARFGRDPLAPRPLKGLRVLDIGCGGGLACEPLARLGATVTGIDASARNLAVAASHAAAMGLAIDYRETSAEALGESGGSWDLVLTLEILEHVADRESFLAAAAGLVAPGGLLVAATLSRTPKAFLLAVVGAEYLLRWLPRGTHDWRRFLRPSELSGALRRQGLTVSALTGVAYDPFAGRWSLAPRDLDVNYMLAATKPGG